MQGPGIGPGPYTLGMKYVFGTTDPNDFFSDGNLMTEQLKRSTPVRIDREKLRAMLKKYCGYEGVGPLPLPNLNLGNELGDVAELLYVPSFFMNLLANPTDSWVWSFTGGSAKVIQVNCCEKTAKIRWDAKKVSGAASNTRLPPSLGGYNSGLSLQDAISRALAGWRSAPYNPYYTSDTLRELTSPRSILSDDPFGPNAPFNTINQYFQWDEIIRF